MTGYRDSAKPSEHCPTCFSPAGQKGGVIPVITCELCGWCKCDRCIRFNRERLLVVAEQSAETGS